MGLAPLRLPSHFDSRKSHGASRHAHLVSYGAGDSLDGGEWRRADKAQPC